jgi:hypothetical protein
MELDGGRGLLPINPRIEDIFPFRGHDSDVVCQICSRVTGSDEM